MPYPPEWTYILNVDKSVTVRFIQSVVVWGILISLLRFYYGGMCSAENLAVAVTAFPAL
jgi:hypothetical protein